MLYYGTSIMKAMILAAGLGQRMLHLTNTIPKPLIKLNNKFLIEYVIENLKNAGITEIIINIYHLKEQIKNALKNGNQWGVNIQYSEESELLDTGGGILQAIQSNLIGKEPFIVISSDIITNFDIRKLLAKLAELAELDNLNNLAHLILVPNPYFKPYGDFSLDNHYLTLPSKNYARNYTYANIGFFDPKFFANVQEKILPLSKIIKQYLQDQTQQITAEVYDGLWQNIGTLEDLQGATINV
ncbi:MAG: nucleotidyltransferase family protein [Gammaproteobacteria bacterium]